MVHGGGSRGGGGGGGGGGGSRSGVGGSGRNSNTVVRHSTTTTTTTTARSHATTTSTSTTSGRHGGGTRTAGGGGGGGGGGRNPATTTSSNHAGGARTARNAPTSSSSSNRCNNGGGGGGGGGSRNTVRQTTTTTTTTTTPPPRNSGHSGARNQHMSTTSRIFPIWTSTSTSTSTSTRSGSTNNRNTVSTLSGSTERHGGGSRRVIDYTTTTTRTTDRFNRYRHADDDDDYLEEPLLIRPRRRSPEDEEGNNCCCHGFACLCCVTALSFLGCFCTPCIMAIKAHRAKSTIPLIAVTVLLLVFQIMLSGPRRTWIMNAGESRQIIPSSSFWTKTIDVQVLTPHTTVEIDVYAIRGKCPPLTGPQVSIHHDLDMTFGAGDYQYDYFFLNKGSHVEAGLYQIQGTAEVYMLKGQDKVDILQEQHHDDPNWLDNLLRSATMSWTVKDYYRQIVAKFASNKDNDVYTLVYDNPYQTNGHLLVDLYLDLTTHNTKAYKPICDDLAYKHCAPIPNRYSQCMLIDTSTAYGEGEEVTIMIVEYRNYTFIVLLSLIPTVLAIVWELWSCLREKTRTWGGNNTQEEDDNDNNIDNNTELNSPSDTTTITSAPPTPTIIDTPTASHLDAHTPSAPPASQDDTSTSTSASASAIPVATARIIVEDTATAAAAAAPVTTIVEPFPAPTNEKN